MERPLRPIYCHWNRREAIAKAASTTAVSSSVNPSDFGQSVTFTATVTSGAGTPTGTVQFKDNGVNLGAPGTAVTSPTTFGRITGPLNRGYGTGTARQMQFMFRLNF